MHMSSTLQAPLEAGSPPAGASLPALLEHVRRLGTPSGLNLIAFSGGVDSSLVAALVHRAFPGRATAVIGVSASLPDEQLQLARQVAEHIGIPLRELSTHEGDLPEYIANQGQSCYHCKTTLYQTLYQLAEALEQALEQALAPGEGAHWPHPGLAGTLEPPAVVLFNGTNADDVQDPTRLGLLAAREHRVVSPLIGLTKQEVRSVARVLELPNAGHAASPCLRSRLAYGVRATPEALAQVEAAERAVRTRLALGFHENLRVRALGASLARIELEPTRLTQAVALRSELASLILAHGYQSLELAPFRTGSLSGYAALKEASLEV